MEKGTTIKQLLVAIFSILIVSTLLIFVFERLKYEKFEISIRDDGSLELGNYELHVERYKGFEYELEYKFDVRIVGSYLDANRGYVYEVKMIKEEGNIIMSGIWDKFEFRKKG